MTPHYATTPFGRRTMPLAHLAALSFGEDLSSDSSISKWSIFQEIKEARQRLGLSDRSLAVLGALLTFYPGTDLTSDADLIVWPSNEQLAARANGMPASTLRRHLAALVGAGLVIRRDSPNGKRYARRDGQGRVEQAFGFDITPVLARVDEFRDMAEAIRADRRAHKAARERVSILRRDVGTLIESAVEEGAPGDWARVRDAYIAIVGDVPRRATMEDLIAIGNELDDLKQQILDVLESLTESNEMSGNASHSERHIQNSNPDLLHESENSNEKNDEAGAASPPRVPEQLDGRYLPLGIVLEACPDIGHMTKEGRIREWKDLFDAAELARPMLGISPSAWHEARDVLGHRQSAVTLAAILQKGESIGNAGGYLRALTDRARAGCFSATPMVMALLRSRLTEHPTAV
ncbi:plasmid replication protein RepC [Amorphus sp. 3PC139-8]|uniref:plasmid replication protein RepC n=1 Tax=Amorphus sp. 3PC139-8 TaxID=2735676 RepID=UPI00345D1D79